MLLRVMLVRPLGADFMEKEITTDSGEPIKLMLWDTAGQEMFSQLTRNYYRGAGAVVYVFSTTDRESFLEVERWRGKVEAECGGIVSVLVQNKIDLLERAQVSPAEVEELSRRLGMKLYRTCVKDNVRVDEVFEYLAESFLSEGGAAAGIEAVTSIGDMASDTAAAAAAAAASPNARANANVTSPAAAPRAAQQQKASPKESAPSGGFQLTPLTVRTDGKKKAMCNIL
jgi:Ras-related protein Rab-23